MRDTQSFLELCKPAPFMFGENGHMAVTDGSEVWIVVVTEEAMKATAVPAEASLKRLSRHARRYRDLAAAALRRGDGVNGKVWVLERDVLAARRTHSFDGGRAPRVVAKRAALWNG